MDRTGAGMARPVTVDEHLDSCSQCEASLAYLTAYYDRHGFAPSFRQIGEHAGLTSTSSVHYHLTYLKRAGRIIVSGSRGAIPIREEN